MLAVSVLSSQTGCWWLLVNCFYIILGAERKQCIICDYSSMAGLEFLFPRRYVPVVYSSRCVL